MESEKNETKKPGITGENVPERSIKIWWRWLK